MEKLFRDYVRQYPVSKTIRFELIPQGKTLEYIETKGIIAADERKVEAYVKVKKIIDDYHKNFISESLSKLHLGMLSEYVELYNIPKRDDKEQKMFEKKQQELRKAVIESFKENPRFEGLFKSELITKDLLECVDTEEEIRDLMEFNKFTTYFTTGFFENRKNMYSVEAKSTSIAYRIVDQNLPKYIDNQKILESIKDSAVYERILNLVKEDEVFRNILGELSLEEFFSIEHYEKTVTNEDISNYNTLIGGYTDKTNDRIKHQGMNEIVNCYNQEYSRISDFRKLPKMKPLYKQILSDRETMSFIADKFENDKMLLDSVAEVTRQLHETVFSLDETCSIEALLRSLEQYDMNRIYVKAGSALSDISQFLYGDWAIIKGALEADYDAEHLKDEKKKNEKYVEKRAKELNKRKSYSIQYLNDIMHTYTDCQEEVQCYFSRFGEKEGRKNLLAAFSEAYQNAEELLCCAYYHKKGLQNDQKSIALIKNLLDAVKDIERFCAPLTGEGTESDKDAAFYGEFTVLFDAIQNAISPLYNKVRNYVTQKPYSTEKIKLNFDAPTLLNGWDKNKETSNLALLFEKEGLYYLGIMDKKNNKAFENVSLCDDEKCYRKMNYKLLPGPNKMLPKVFFSKKNIDFYNPSAELLAHYELGTHKKGEQFNIAHCHQLIDFFKQSIEKNEDWQQFGFQFSDTSSYKDISEFYKEVEKQGYKIDFTNVSSEYIDSLVEEGKLYLFQIYNKDFSTYSKGNPNLHTIYWKMLFDEKNLQNVVYKLNGEAEVFYRKASIDKENMIVHKKNEKIKQKNLKAIEEGRTSEFAYDLIKDRRFTVDKFQLHVPITMNFAADGKTMLNDMVQQTIREQENINVIGIDRGERNLLYISVVDQKGRILHQESMNVIENDKGFDQDYHALLNAKESKNKEARQNWQEIGTIKELKEGYLSLVIHKIAGLMLQYNAIVVLEDLNFGFMNGRKKVEKQVYQKFEKMLIDKLNYLVLKTRNIEENGGALWAYQLTNRFESFQKLGKQSGFLFYIPAWNTSKIDPTTGFVNLFSVKYTNVAEAQKFFAKFDSIRFNSKENIFEFAFDYDKFTEKAAGTRTKWTLCSWGERLKNARDPKQNSNWITTRVNLTDEFKLLFEKYELDIGSESLKEDMLAIDRKEFWESLIHIFKLMLQIRNSETGTDIDYLLSPVRNQSGTFFDSRKEQEKKSRGEREELPLDADANGAYNIARKGLRIIEQIKNSDGSKKVNLAMKNKEWLAYAQSHTICES